MYSVFVLIASTGVPFSVDAWLFFTAIRDAVSLKDLKRSVSCALVVAGTNEQVSGGEYIGAIVWLWLQTAVLCRLTTTANCACTSIFSQLRYRY